eukprot:CAMPEP_0201523398 /NCGR_PEP_ID=MMETSP0161_2-20130828/19675_1 /ASSEMBLY_ACC=CAM_ASM_000251 /TAXON_ID=180227 /ORGANISM="Neoparamoeba aestuarina, Strain SoJaBio B1-5/56/2" /LENGTH=97 /DNA_ID=CAMNT_0047922503 /DNA_START=198 /DNA_END=491 /DNA_ORIENTATION=-
MLLVENEINGMRLYCQTCPYVYHIQEELSVKLPLTAKKVDDVLGGEEAWEGVDKTATKCPECSHHEAYYILIQIRSADEPSSVFYKCCKCGHRWRED